MLFCKNITKSFGAQTLLEEADFQLNKGERVGIVGRNGYGKSTLFKVILKQDTLDDGEISYPENYRIKGLDQNLNFEKDSIVEEVSKVLPKNHEHDIWKAEKILSGLGFSPKDFLRKPQEFSGGFQIRIKLAELLLSEPDLLLLDEPTNHLDIVSIRWLEKFLSSWKNEIMCVSHDQTFLENITTHTVGIHRQKLKKIKGAPQKLYNQIKQEEEIYEKTRLNSEKEKKRQEKFIREFRSGARSAGLVQSRIKMLDKKKNLKPLSKIPPIKFQFLETEFQGAKLLETRNISFNYETNKKLIEKFTLELFPGEKVGIIGANGKGKSTLLNLLAKNLDPKSGKIKFHPNLKTGFFGQSNINLLDPQKNIIEELNKTGSHNEQTVRSVAGSLLFSGDLAYKKIEILSGGEKARINLGKILLTPTNLLLLDEPTNHLDYESVEALIKAVKTFSGGVIFISHNEEFLKKVAEKLIIFDNNEIFIFPGTYQEFLNKKGFSSEEKPEKNVLKNITEKRKLPVHKEIEKEKKRLLRPLEREVKKIEKEISELEKLQEQNKENFFTAQRQGNRLKMETLGIEYEKLQQKINLLFEEWSKISKEVEKINELPQHS